MIRNGHPSIAICDSCGAEAEAIEQRNPRTGQLSRADLPEGWKFDVVGGEHIHRCAECYAASVEPFADRRAAFEARLDHIGAGFTVDIAASLSVPIAIGRRWAGEWKSDQAAEAARLHQILGRQQDATAGLGAHAAVLHPGGQLDDRQGRVGAIGGGQAEPLGEPFDRGGRVVGQLDIGDQRNAKRLRGRWHGAAMRDPSRFINRGVK